MSELAGPDRRLVGALLAEFEQIDALLGSLAPADWQRPTALPGWQVRDVAAHVLGTEAMMDGRPLPDPPDVLGAHVRNEIAAVNERWVRSLRDHAPAHLLAELREVLACRRTALGRLGTAELDADSWTPVGPATYRRFLQIRIFDCWLHEQDIRDALGRPGHQDGPCAQAAVDEVERALGYLVGKRAGAPAGAAITFEIEPPAARTLHVQVDRRAAVVAALDRPADVVVRLPGSLFVRLAGGRLAADAARDQVRLDGDRDLGLRILTNLAFTI